MVNKSSNFGQFCFGGAAPAERGTVRSAVDAESHTTPVWPNSPTEFTIGHNVNSSAELDAVMREAAAAGAIL